MTEKGASKNAHESISTRKTSPAKAREGGACQIGGSVGSSFNLFLRDRTRKDWGLSLVVVHQHLGSLTSWFRFTGGHKHFPTVGLGGLNRPLCT